MVWIAVRESVRWVFWSVIALFRGIVGGFTDWFVIQVEYVLFCVKVIFTWILITAALGYLWYNGIIDGLTARIFWFICCLGLWLVFMWRTWRTSLLGRLTVWIVTLPFRLCIGVLNTLGWLRDLEEAERGGGGGGGDDGDD